MYPKFSWRIFTHNVTGYVLGSGRVKTIADLHTIKLLNNFTSHCNTN